MLTKDCVHAAIVHYRFAVIKSLATPEEVAAILALMNGTRTPLLCNGGEIDFVHLVATMLSRDGIVVIKFTKP